jgi:hypothetical protein
MENEWEGCFVLCALCFVLCALCLVRGAGCGVRGAYLAFEARWAKEGALWRLRRRLALMRRPWSLVCACGALRGLPAGALRRRRTVGFRDDCQRQTAKCQPGSVGPRD